MTKAIIGSPGDPSGASPPHRADEPADRSLVGQDADNVCAPLDLAVPASYWIRTAKLRAMLPEKLIWLFDPTV
ncbi:hypothetical protein IT41_15165 [Paracoccus halophilus]|uniref:Uncharacterized protein n=1 Tax=Paracoccus halophilus TaxID=376733 RepID=A0A099EYX1_9RHOB|nr:hypothetical protein IT41_15165 [Paracoccus halophilus]